MSEEYGRSPGLDSSPAQRRHVRAWPDVLRTADGARSADAHSASETARTPAPSLNLQKNLAHWRTWLATQGPIFVGVNVDATWDNATATHGKLDVLQPNTVRGGHAPCIVGYTSDSRFIVRNSWGTTWGDHGFAYASVGLHQRGLLQRKLRRDALNDEATTFAATQAANSLDNVASSLALRVRRRSHDMVPHRNRFLHLVRARPRIFIALACALAIGLLLPQSIARQPVTRWLLAWNVGTGLYVLLAAIMMIRSSTHHMRRRAQQQDDGQFVILVLVVVAAVASLAAIAGELTVVKDMHGFAKSAHVALAGLTVLTSWAFIQVMFALHYAHDYYAAVCHSRPAGLQFPGEESPDYGDFFYFAAVIGTSGQTADVSFVSKPMRRIGSMHCILAYLFNTTVLALLINIGASLL